MGSLIPTNPSAVKRALTDFLALPKIGQALMKKSIAAIFADSLAAKQRFLQEHSQILEKVIEEVVRTLKAGG